jgi:membrane protease YdiL (CAAX protease family)
LEEILCRGFVYQLTKGYGAFLSALVGAITFMLFHQNFAQFPLAFCFGFAIGYMIYRFKNIWIGIISHFIVNLIACLSSLADSLWHIDENIVSLLFEIYLALVLSLGFLSLTYLIAAGKLKAAPATDRCPRALSSILLSPAYIVFTVVSIAISIYVWL